MFINKENKKNSVFSKEEVAEIKRMIKQGILYKDITAKFGARVSFLSKINTGKYYYDKNETYPLCIKKNSCREEDNRVWVEGVINDILTTKMCLADIAKKWNKSYATIKKLNQGYSHKHLDLTYPLNKNKKI